MNPHSLSTPGHPSMDRRRFVQAALASVVGVPVLMACSPEVTPFKSTDVTGAAFAQDFRLKDHHGQLRTLADFKGKIVVTFFGFTQCPDVCPTSMTTMAEVKRLLGGQGERLQVLFITVDPERDTQALLKEYMASFDPGFIALRPEPDELKDVAAAFKIYYKKVCIDPAVSAQVRLLKHKPQPGSSWRAPGEGAGGCRSRSSLRSRGWRVGGSRTGGGARIGL